MMGGTLEGQHQRTVELIEHLLDTDELTLHGLLYLLHDTQATTHINRLAEIAATRPSRLRRQAENSECPCPGKCDDTGCPAHYAEEPARHEWGGEGDRCVKCGDKDWMADPVCSESKLRRQSEGER